MRGCAGSSAGWFQLGRLPERPVAPHLMLLQRKNLLDDQPPNADILGVVQRTIETP
jgi:hypothetical protein